jgi:hypothetical protein
MTHELQPPYLTPTGDSHQTLLTLSNEYFVPGYDNFTTELPESQNATSSIYVARQYDHFFLPFIMLIS